ncbi:MAG: AbrB/MazE/SpoVT family DNA-binding domain-containing protein [Deltaproteobacteria bacterium]|nr:AbrB/MazE/SpoVT family DNA-binding domain-containing protein [Deltaproteobacteria bacterium]
MTLRISQKGWVVIPAHLRKKYDLKPGDEVHVVDYGGVLSLIPTSEDPLEVASGMLKGKTSLTKALLQERKKDRARER